MYNLKKNQQRKRKRKTTINHESFFFLNKITICRIYLHLNPKLADAILINMTQKLLI